MSVHVEQIGAPPAGTQRAPSQKRPMGLGDLIERLAHPIAVALKLPCLDAQQRLKTDSPCGRRRDAANRLGEKIAEKIGLQH